MVAKFIGINKVIMTFLGSYFLRDEDNSYLFKFKIGEEINCSLIL